MHIRPRCSEWIPLSTQQLRLRNLVRIQGVNIEYTSGSNSLIYYTLHQTHEAPEFYRSEPLPARQEPQKWAEITCIEMIKSNLNCVCVKVWERFEDNDSSSFCKQFNHMENHAVGKEEQKSALSHNFSSDKRYLVHNSLPPRPPDKILFTWGVYFSGLICIHETESIKYLPNSLIFQLNGDCFVSPEYVTLNTLREQLSLNCNRFSSSVPKDEKPISDEFSINSPKVSPSTSPVPFATDSNGESKPDLLTMSKARYIDLLCSPNEVRNGYDLQKLLEIQELQRLYVQKSNEALDFIAGIKQQCIRCITTEQLTKKKRTTSTSASTLHHYQHHSMGRALSLLLSEQQRQHNPQELLRAQKLQQQIETLRCRKRMLETESDIYSSRISKLHERLTKISESRQNLQESLQKQQQNLSADREQLNEIKQNMRAQLLKKRSVVHNVERRMSSLCMELREIYPINRNQQGLYTICDIPFPNMDAYLNDARYVVAQAANITPMALNASLGYVAHLVQMMAVIINKSLRNPIHHEGSQTRILDIVRDLPFTSREYPLYSRSTIPSKPVKYAIYLLNQNIAQLCYDITGIRGDLRATIENILNIFANLSEIDKNQMRGIHSHCLTQPSNRLTLQSSDRQQQIMDSVSNSHSSVDLNNVPVPNLSPMTLLPSSIPMPIADRSLPQPRISRSVGSYSDCDDDFKDIVDHCYRNSDSNITNQSFAN